MHSLRLQCCRLNLYRNSFSLLKKYSKPSITSCCSKFSTQLSNLDEADQFRAAVLHPKKQNLTVETLVLPETAADGMVNTIYSILSFEI